MSDASAVIAETAKRVADERETLHANHASSRPLSEGYEARGLLGEMHFALRYGLRVDLERKPGGDGGTDFAVPLLFTVDVKTAVKAYNLIVEIGKVTADIYVLARDRQNGTVEFLGWAWRATVLAAPVSTFGHGIANHFIPKEQLLPMEHLDRRIARLVSRETLPNSS